MPPSLASVYNVTANGKKGTMMPSRVQHPKTPRANHQHEFIRAGLVCRRAIYCDTVHLKLHRYLSWLALALELCSLSVPGLADCVCLLELLVEGPGMISPISHRHYLR